jgi:hypothetical protein
MSVRITEMQDYIDIFLKMKYFLVVILFRKTYRDQLDQKIH